MRVIVFLFLLTFCLIVAKSQSVFTDSLKLELKKSKSDTLIVQILNNIGIDYLNNYPDSTKYFSESAYRLAIKTDFERGKAISLNYLGRYYARIGQYTKAADYFLKCLNVGGYADENKVKTTTYYDLGQLYASLSSMSGSKELHNKRVFYLKKSIESFLLLKESERQGDLAFLEAAAYIELGRSYMNIMMDSTKLDSAIYFLKHASELSDKVKSFEVSFLALEGLGNAYYFKHQFTNAIDIGYQLLALSGREDNKNHYRVMSFMKLGEFYRTINFDSSNYYFSKCLKEINRGGEEDKIFIAGVYNQLGQLHFEYKQYKKAIRYFKQEIEFEKKLNISNIEVSFLYVADSYKALGDYKKAFEFQSQYIHLKDSLQNEDTSANLARLQADFESAHQSDQIKMLENEAQVNELLLVQKQNQQILIGLVSLFLLVFIGVLIARNRLIQKSKREQEKLFTQMDQLKSRFFANISHEFRTPLTLLLGPLEKHVALANNSEEKAEFSMMHRNGSRLLTLVNQLLDLSRFEAGTMRLQASQGDVIGFVTITMSEFQSIADSKNIQFKLRSSFSSLQLYFDEDKLKKILSNLFSNAFKFTQEGGTITVDITQSQGKENFTNGCVEIKISDNGIGIEEDDLAKVFERFYQVDNSTTRSYEGSGIGLALTKELVELHHGDITANSQLETGTSFCVRLPLGKQHLSPQEMIKDDSKQKAPHVRPIEYVENGLTHETAEQQDVILIIEDNEDLRSHLRKELSAKYKIFLARDGEEGVQYALEKVPSLIISDLMMPKKDGLTVCAELKTDERTSHIPFILLTAKVEVESRLDGFRKGADDYIAKPFSLEELVVRIHNLIEGRRILQKKYAQRSMHLMPNQLSVESVEDKFLRKINLIVEKYLDDTSFSVEVFADEIGMSQVQLYRKLKALTNYSPNEFIRHMRLQRAADLLRQNAGNIAEVAYQSGFNNLSYFAKVFKEKFGVTPSEFMKQKQN